MLMIIFSGLAILPLLIICFGGLFLRNYMRRRTMMIAMFVGFAALAAELANFYQITHTHIDLRQWILISDLMSIFPIYASLTVIILAMLVYMIFEGAQKSKLTLSVLSLSVIAVIAVRATAFNGQLLELETNNKMLTQKLSTDQMQQIAASGSVKEKIVLATRGDLALEVIQKLIQDPNEIIRFYGLVNPGMDLKDLEQLKASDESAEIRKQAGIEIKRRKIK